MPIKEEIQHGDIGQLAWSQIQFRERRFRPTVLLVDRVGPGRFPGDDRADGPRRARSAVVGGAACRRAEGQGRPELGTRTASNHFQAGRRRRRHAPRPLPTTSGSGRALRKRSNSRRWPAHCWSLRAGYHRQTDEVPTRGAGATTPETVLSFFSGGELSWKMAVVIAIIFKCP